MKWLKKSKELAIIIDEAGIRFLEVITKDNQILKVRNHIFVDDYIIRDGVLDKFKLEQILKTVLREHKIRAKNVHVVIPSSQVIIRQQTMPNLPEKDLKQMVQFEIGNTIHLPFDNPVIDIVKIGEVESEQNEVMSKVAIVAASGDLIYPLVERLKENRLRPKKIDIPALSLYRLFSHRFPDQAEQPILLGNITRLGIDLHILDEGILSFTRHIPLEMGNFVQDVFENEELDPNTIFKEIIKQENYQTFVKSIGYEIDRATDFFQYTLNNRDKRFAGCFLASDIHFPSEFYQYLQDRVGIDVSPLTFELKLQHGKEEKLETYRGFEAGFGMFFKRAVVTNGD